MTLQPRTDGFYDIFDSDGDQVALLHWCVQPDRRNDRGGEVGSAYPLTLDEFESIITRSSPSRLSQTARVRGTAEATSQAWSDSESNVPRTTGQFDLL